MRYFFHFVLVTALVAVAFAGTNTTSTSHYCAVCGMKRGQTERDWFGIPFQNGNRIYPTGYSVLFRQVQNSSHAHGWIFTGSYSSGSLLKGGAIGCGGFPRALRYAPLLRRLEGLDKPQIQILLQMMPLRAFTTKKQNDRIDLIIDSAIDLGDHPTPLEHKQWWQRFQKSLKTLPAR